MFVCFFQKGKDLHERGKAFIGGEESEVKKEISKAQDRVIMESVSRGSVMLCASGWLPKGRDGTVIPQLSVFPQQRQDVSVVEAYLQSLVLDSCEETF